MIRNLLKHVHHPRWVRGFVSSSSLSHCAAATPALNLNEAEEEGTQKRLLLSHPWPEWVNFMQCLLNNGYFNKEGNPFQNAKLGPNGTDIIQNACLKFGKDHIDLASVLSREDLAAAVALGCPSLYRKVVNSAKRLRAYLGIDEGNVCSSCSMRGNCKRIYVIAREDEHGRTVDVMRVILTYGLDSVTASVENKPCRKNQITESVRRLLKEIVEHSTKDENNNSPDTTEVVDEQVHPNLEGEKDVPMKQGD